MVDDQPARLLTYEAILSGLHVRCVRALSGEEALAKLLEQEFAVILLDVSMPVMDGFEVARLIREHPRLEKTPIIFVTAVCDRPSDLLRGYEVGAIDYISVPVAPEVLRSKVAILVELHRRREELQELNRQLAEATVRESERRYRALIENFLAMLAHELRNPVAPIMSAADALSLILDGDDKARSLALIVKRQTRSLSVLLDDLLDVARITQGLIQLRREVVSLETCIELAIETASPLIAEKGHRVTIGRSAVPLFVNVDRIRLGQCLANLLINAAKYTDAGGEIRIRPYRDGTDAVIEVSDNGHGISAQFLPRLFELFAQGERALDRPQSGLGIGLCVCKQLIEMQGGSVRGESAGLGQGATFTLRLPIHIALLPAPEPAPRSEITLRILIVDDNRDAADALAALLKLDGHEVRTAYGAADALAQLVEFAPDVGVLDIGLPTTNGYELARQIRKSIAPGLKLIALSGYGQPADRARSADAGFDTHLVKPVEIAVLREMLQPA